TRLPAETLLSMHNEILAGEAMNSTDAEALYRRQVEEHAAGTFVKSGFETGKEKNGQEKKPKRKPSGQGFHQRKPGVRRPGRDPVKTAAERQSGS
ncbi:MAG: hypothetical protein Q8L38_11855, partial [Pseudohongiella sp.]|nr:hypothetical protein [Pseudohongiella sp.]